MGEEGFAQNYTQILTDLHGDIKNRIIFGRGEGANGLDVDIYSRQFYERNTMSFGGMWRRINVSTFLTRNRLFREIFWSGNTYLSLDILGLPGSYSITNPHRFTDDLINWLWPRDYDRLQANQEEFKHEDVEEEKKDNNQSVIENNEPPPESLVEQDNGMNVIQNIQQNPNIPNAVRNLLLPSNAQDLQELGEAINAVANELPPYERARLRLSTNHTSALFESFVRDNIIYEGQDVAAIVRAQIIGARMQDLMSSWVNRVVEYLEREAPNLATALNLFNYTLIFIASFGNNAELRKKLLKALMALMSLMGFIIFLLL
jgi:hypothetical protein